MKTELEKKDEEIARLKLLLQMSESSKKASEMIHQARITSLEIQLASFQNDSCKKSEFQKYLDREKGILREGEYLINAENGFYQGGCVQTIKCTPVGVVIPSELYVKNGDERIRVNSLDEAKDVCKNKADEIIKNLAKETADKILKTKPAPCEENIDYSNIEKGQYIARIEDGVAIPLRDSVLYKAIDDCRDKGTAFVMLTLNQNCEIEYKNIDCENVILNKTEDSK